MSTRDQGQTAITPSAFEPLDSQPAAKKGRKRHWRSWLLPACVLLFILVMGFLFTARSVEIEVSTETEASIDIDALYLPFGERFLLLPGEYPLQITAAGYHPLSTRLQVGAEGTQQFQFTPQPLPGRITLRSEPAGASISLAGEPLGSTTPQEGLELAVGEHALRLEHPRYLPLDETLQVTGRDVAQTFVFALQPAWAEVTVKSVPEGAEILVDGEARGVTPTTLELLQGERQLLLRHPGYATWQQELTVVAGEPRDLGQLQLLPAAGVLTLNSDPPAANVTLDGEFQGQTPLTLNLEPDRPQRLTLSRPGYRRHSETLELAAGASASRDITLKAQLGEVDLQVSPAAAEVRVNGRLLGTGSQTLSLPAFEHRVEVSLDGYATLSQRVTPRPGLQQRLDLELQTVQEAKLARLPQEITTPVGQTLRLFIPGESGRSEFTMGASRREPGRRANEVLRPVVLRRMFYLQTTEVTNAQFRQFLAQHNSGQVQGNSLNREHQPVAQVSWQQAAQFCNWLSRKEGLPPFYRQEQGIVTGFDAAATGYRLPTEAEWSWAARVKGDELLIFPWGDGFPPPAPVENYADSSSAYITGRVISGYEDGHVVSATVGSFAPNHQQLHDLGGNVAEWVHDVYQIPGANSPTETDPLGSQLGDNYVIRGASWALGRMSELRLSFRDYGQAGRDDVGFRIARYAE